MPRKIVMGACLLLFMMPRTLVAAPMTKNVEVGMGFSLKSDADAAVKEASKTAREQLGRKKPDYIITFYTEGYDPARLSKAIAKQFGKKARIFGGSSCSAVYDNAGIHKGDVSSLNIMAVLSSKMTFGVGSSSFENINDVEAGRMAITNAMEDAGKKGIKPDMILMVSAPGHEEAVITGIESIVGRDVLIVGGSAADNKIAAKWTLIGNNKAYGNGVALTAIYTKLKIGTSFQSGYEVAYDSGYQSTNKIGAITKAAGRTILEIDSQPAAVVYNSWLDGQFKDKLETGGNILLAAAFHPLAKKITLAYSSYALSIHPAAINSPDKSVSVFADVKAGDAIELMSGTTEALINRGISTPTLALQGASLKADDVAFGVSIFCAGTMLAIPENRRGEIVSHINKVLRNRPFIGIFPFGEQGNVFEIGNLHGNLSSSMVLFSNKEK